MTRAKASDGRDRARLRLFAAPAFPYAAAVACRRLFVLVLLCALAAPRIARAQDEPLQGAGAASLAPADATLTLPPAESELAEIVKAVAAQTGERFLFDDRLRGRITITAPRPVRRDEAVALLAAALRMAGFALIRTPAGASEIVPVAETAGRVEFSSSTPRAFVDAPVTTLIPLRAADATDLVSTLKPVLGSSAVVQAFAPSNSLIVSATEAQLHRALILIRALDQAQERRLVVLRPRFRSAEELLPAVQAMFPESRRASESLRLFVDARSSALLLEGPPDLVTEVREFIRTLDLPVAGTGGIHVVRLRHADAEELAAVIQEAASDGSGAEAAPGAAEAGDTLTGRDFGLSVDEATNSLVLRCDPETFRLLARLIGTLDVDVPSVSVKTTLLELEDTGSLDAAIDSILPFTRPATASDGAGFVRALNSGDPSLLGVRPAEPDSALVLRYISDPVTFTRTDADGRTTTEIVPGYGVDVKAQATAARTRLLSEPHILARSGEEQEIFIGNNIPIIAASSSSAAGTGGAVSSPAPAGSTLALSQTIERQDVGVRLRVAPTATEEGPVRLELRLEFSALAAPFGGDVNVVGPTLVKQSVESTIYLDDGAGAVVGVRGEPTQEVVRTGTPWLMDVPVLGWLFGSRSTRSVQKDLLLAVQVKVIRSPSDLELESIRRRVAMERSVAGLEELSRSPAESPFAVWIGTAQSREAAEELASGFDVGTRRAEVVAWASPGPGRFDVFVLGFDRFADAMKTSLEARARGYQPEVVALPGQP